MRYSRIIGLAVIGIVFCAFLPVLSTWTCAPLRWYTPKSWYSGSLLQQSFYMQGCGILETRNDLYDCDPAKPYQQCKEDSQCPSGQLCGEGMAPRMCVECRTSISNTWFEQVNVTTNVTASLLAGKFWGKDEFYNHTGVDLIVTEENWSWSASGNALSRDWVKHQRSTWGDRYDSDDFWTISERYTVYNATHVMVQSGSLRRASYDAGNGWVSATSAVNYYPTLHPPKQTN